MSRISTYAVTFLLIIVPWISSNSGTIRVPGQSPTIQDGIDLAQAGDTVLVSPGVYAGLGNVDLDLLGKPILLVSEAGPAKTIIRCDGDTSDAHRAFNLHNGEDTTTIIKGFTIESGYGADMAVLVMDGPSYYQSIGGAIYCDSQSTLMLVDCTLQNCRADHGGAIFVGNGSGIVLRDCRIIGNSSTDYGGAIQSSEGSSMIIENCRFAKNHAASGGGAAYLGRGSEIRIANTVFESDSAAFGGALLIGSNSHVIIEGCKFVGNRGHREGGAIFASDCQLDISETEFHANFTIRGDIGGGGGGGAIHVEASELAIRDCQFAENKTQMSGGGLELGRGCTGTISNCAFVNNTASQWSGACGLSSESDVTLDSCSFVGNSANFGGAIVINRASPTFTSCVFERNRAQAGGGAIHYMGGSGAFHVTEFRDNHSRHGGAVSASGASPTFDSCTFILNDSMAYSSLSGSPTFRFCAFEQNRGQMAGAIQVSKGDLIINNCEFSQNVSDGSGGAVSHYRGSLGVESSLFTENSAKGHGGALSLFEVSAELSHLTFVGNAAGFKGGAVSVMRTKSLLKGCSFAENSAPEATIAYLDVSTTFTECALDFAGDTSWVDCSYPRENYAVLERCIISSQTLPDYADCQQGSTDVIIANPQFCTGGGQTLTIRADSPCLPQNNPWGILIGASSEICRE